MRSSPFLQWECQYIRALITLSVSSIQLAHMPIANEKYAQLDTGFPDKLKDVPAKPLPYRSLDRSPTEP
jgi:hypothetical protein